MLEDPDTEAPTLMIGVQADEETYLPEIVIGIPAEEGEGSIKVAITPVEAMNVGAALIQMATVALNFLEELLPKSLDERKEIVDLEKYYLGVLSEEEE